MPCCLLTASDSVPHNCQPERLIDGEQSEYVIADMGYYSDRFPESIAGQWCGGGDSVPVELQGASHIR